jgi:hypothetical protein
MAEGRRYDSGRVLSRLVVNEVMAIEGACRFWEKANMVFLGQ